MQTINLHEPNIFIYPRIKSNIRYDVNSEATLSVIMPFLKDKTANSHLPVMLFLSQDDHTASMIEFSKKQYVVVILNIKDNLKLLEKIKQTRSALSYLITHAYQFGINTNKIHLWAEKSACELAFNLVLTNGNQKFSNEDVRFMRYRFSSCILYNPLFDIDELTPQIKKTKFYLADNRHSPQLDNLFDVLSNNAQYCQLVIQHGNQTSSDAFYNPYILDLIHEFIVG